MEAAGLGIFMISAGLFATLVPPVNYIQHFESPNLMS
jgi:hypothetical protein